jgi:Sulfotransferase family
MQDTGVLVIGTQRSGTTLLNRVLNAHPDMALLYQQTNFLRLDPHSYDLGSSEERLRLIADARRVCRVYSKRFDDAVEDELVSEFGTADRSVTAGDVYRAVLRRLTPKQGTKYWGEKYAGRAVDALKFIDIVPGGKVVHIMRDPRDVCASEKRRMTAQFGMTEDEPAFLLMVYDWKIAHFIGRYIQTVATADYHRLRYEDLVTKPEQTVAGICRFLGLPFAPEMLQAGQYTDDEGAPWEANSFFESGVKSVRADFTGRWQKALRPSEALFVEQFCRAGMKDFGYPMPSAWSQLVATLRQRTDLRRLATEAEQRARTFIADPAYKTYIPKRFGDRIDFARVDRLYCDG